MKPIIFLLTVFTITPAWVFAGHGINRVGEESFESAPQPGHYTSIETQDIPGHGINRNSGQAEDFVQGLEVRLGNEDYLCFPRESY